MTKTSKQLTSSYKLKAIVLLSAVVFMAVTMPASASAVQEEGQGQEKVMLCHKGSEIEVSPNAVPAHLAHGDYIIHERCFVR